MRKKLITIATPEIREIAKPFLDNHVAYAVRNNYEYQCGGEIIFKNLHPSFSKVALIDQAMKDGYDLIIWADADVAFIDQGVDLANLLTSEYFMAAYRQQNWTAWRYLCAGLTVWRNTEKAREFVATWADWCLNGVPGVVDGERVKIHGGPDDRQPIMQDKPWEQWPMDALVRHTKWSGLRCCTADEIGCFSREIWHDGVLWTQACPTVHLGGPASWERRVQVFNEHYKSHVR